LLFSGLPWWQYFERWTSESIGGQRIGQPANPTDSEGTFSFPSMIHVSAVYGVKHLS